MQEIELRESKTSQFNSSPLLEQFSSNQKTFCSINNQIRPKKVGYGSVTGHHAEIVQGMFPENNGQSIRALVTLPCSSFRANASFTPAANNVISVEPADKSKSLRAAELTTAEVGAAGWGGCLRIHSNIPPGFGCGSSTAEVTATIKAVTDALGYKLSPEKIAQLAVRAEKASDPLMYGSQAVLFAQREGKVIEDFDNSLPPLDVLGFSTNALGIDTLTFPPAQYDEWEIEMFRVLRGAMRRAISYQDPRLIGRIASASARINQRYLPKPKFALLKEIVGQAGALGLQVAHSGTVVGLLFDPLDKNTEQKIQQAKQWLTKIGFTATWRFQNN
jgi:uncharacterized protein involved in propanediol utilization